LLVRQQRGVLVVAGELEQAQALGESLDRGDDGDAQDGQRDEHLEEREPAGGRRLRTARRPAHSRSDLTRPVRGSTVTRYRAAPAVTRKRPPLETPCGSKRT